MNPPGLNPQLTDSNSNGISDALEDRDQDGLTNISELSSHLTLPDQPDTDDDGLSDGWEILYGYFALVNNETDADLTNDPDDDPDNDGLLNTDEDQIGTNPNNADTDGDGFSDPVEEQSASSATNPASTPTNPGGTPGGPAAPPPPTIPVVVTFGDHSNSHSEKYKVWLEALEGDTYPGKRWRANNKYGQVQTKTFHLPAGAKYKITLTQIGTDPNYNGDPSPDYDYTLESTSNSTDTAIKAIPEDTSGMLGVHWESEDFFAEGKDTTLYIAWMTSETVATQPQDQKRKKLGVGEEVNLTLKPSSLPSPTWALNGTPGTSALSTTTGITSKLTAGGLACTPTTEATINGEVVKIDFNVIEPATVTFSRTSTSSQTSPSLGLLMAADIYVGPSDVNFMNITVEEGQCGAIAVDYFAYQNGLNHPASSAPVSMTATVDATKGTKANGQDSIGGGTQGPPYSPGTFTWSIPWKYTSGGQTKQFTTINHDKSLSISNSKATLTISKSGASDSITQP